MQKSPYVNIILAIANKIMAFIRLVDSCFGSSSLFVYSRAYFILGKRRRRSSYLLFIASLVRPFTHYTPDDCLNSSYWDPLESTFLSNITLICLQTEINGMSFHPRLTANYLRYIYLKQKIFLLLPTVCQ